jgi:tetratricopeptide (TPR) repeat protein
MVEEGYSRIKLLIDRREFEQALTEIEELHIQKRTIKSAVDRGFICYLRATALQGLGRYKEALCESQKAFEILRNTNENTLIAQIHFLRGIVYSDLGDLARSEDDFRDAVADYKRDSYSKGTTDAYNELARIRFIKGDYERAIEYLTKCISYYEQIGDTRGKAKASANLGRVHIRAGNWKLAEAYLKVSTKAHRESGNRLGFCNGLLSSGYVSYLQRDFVRARQFYKRALRFIHENDYFRELGIYHEYAGELEFAESDLDTARHHFLKAIAIGEKIGDGSALVSQTYRLLAELQISDHEHNEALASSEQALEAARSLKEKIEIGAIHRALGQIYTAKKQKQKAAESFGKSLRVLEQIGAKFELGKSYLEAGKSDCFDLHDQIHYLRRAKEVFKDLDSKYHEGLVYFSISKLLSDNGDSEKALVFLDDAERVFKEANEENELASVSFQKQVYFLKHHYPES